MQTLRSVFMWTIKKYYLYFSVKLSVNYMRGLIFLFFPLLSFSIPPSLNYFMLFRNNSCSTFTVYCKEHNLHFTVTQNTNTFFLLCVFPLSHITYRKSVRIHYFLKIQFFAVFFFLLSSSSLQTFILCVILD